jgi:cytochrome b561
MQPAPQKYSGIAIGLHWLMALGVFAALGIGLTMKQAHVAPKLMFQLFQLHKSIGVTLLLLVVLRLAWRALRRPPPLPETVPPLERVAAQAGHASIYVFLVALPLTGWAMVSVSPLNIPTVLYGFIPWPHLPWFADIEDRKAAETLLKTIHDTGAFIFIALIAGHIAAALRHALKGDLPLARMGLGRLKKG